MGQRSSSHIVGWQGSGRVVASVANNNPQCEMCLVFVHIRPFTTVFPLEVVASVAL